MKILMVTRESVSDRRYGLGKSLASLIDEFEQRGIAVGYLSRSDLGERAQRFMADLQQRLIRAAERGWLTSDSLSLVYGVFERINMGRLAAKVADRDGYSHVHCHDPVIAWGFSVVARFKGRIRVRWGLTEHGFGSYTQALHEDGAVLTPMRMRLLRRWERRVLIAADWVIAPTDGCLNQLSRDLCLYPRPPRWHAIPHPLPRYKHHDRSAARLQLGWDSTSCYLLGVGRLAALKQFPALLRAFALIRHPDARLVILGDGDAAPLKQLAQELGVEHRFEIAVTDDVWLYYQAADIYVSTSQTESFGLANLEALVAGLPSVCTAVGGVPEVVGSAACLIAPNNPSDLVAAVQQLVDDYGMRGRLVQQAAEHVSRWPCDRDLADRYLAAYGSLDVRSRSSTGVPAANGVSEQGLRFWAGNVGAMDLCRLPPRLELPSSGRVLVVAPHPDDEVLACGGTLALLRRRGCQVRVVVVTDGGKGDPLGLSDEDVVARRRRESQNALRKLDIDDIVFLGYPDGGYAYSLSSINDFVGMIDEFGPEWILIPPLLDYHRDHVAASLCVIAAWKATGMRARCLMWEVWQPVPANQVVDISEVIHLRQAAITCHTLAMRYCDYQRASASLAAYRGFYLEGSVAAEAFFELDPQDASAVVSDMLNIRRHQDASPG
jgi:LmbE family N-acetylglucosaminyl deacetylase/glycosyltransferase involved in cell wall biosynthesis